MKQPEKLRINLKKSNLGDTITIGDEYKLTLCGKKIGAEPELLFHVEKINH